MTILNSSFELRTLNFSLRGLLFYSSLQKLQASCHVLPFGGAVSDGHSNPIASSKSRVGDEEAAGGVHPFEEIGGRALRCFLIDAAIVTDDASKDDDAEGLRRQQLDVI